MLLLAGSGHEEVLEKRSVMRSGDECWGPMSGGYGMGLLLWYFERSTLSRDSASAHDSPYLGLRVWHNLAGKEKGIGSHNGDLRESSRANFWTRISSQQIILDQPAMARMSSRANYIHVEILKKACPLWIALRQRN